MAPREPSSRRRDRERDGEKRRDREQRKRRSHAAQPPAGADDEPRRPRKHGRHQSRDESGRDDDRDDRRASRPRRNSLHPAAAAARSADEVAHAEQEQRSNRRREERAARATRPHRNEYQEVVVEKHAAQQPAARRAKKTKRRRHVSGAVLEEGRGWVGMRGGAASTEDGTEKELLYHGGKKQPVWKRKKRLLICIAIFIILLILTIVLAVMISKNNQSKASDGPSTSNLDGKDRDSIPAEFRDTDLDPWSWHDTSDFNVTFTEATVGDLPVMGLFTDWDDSKRPNDKVPAVDQPWGSYGDRPARGVNLGGWLSLEPFITPSLFSYDSELGIIDEYTLCKYLGDRAPEVLERHYATFVTEQTFKDIADAGIDHVRIPFSYWALEVYEGDSYVYRTSWRYLLRGIEWARKYGLRINLDPHGIPGSQNGWNHSGRLGPLNWLAGSDGATNAKRSLEMHDRLSKFFAQDRYRNIIAFYGLANEPKMTLLPIDSVVQWTEDAYGIVRKNGVDAVVVFGDGFMGLGNWKGKLAGLSNLALDVHQYVIFNKNQIVFTHQEKVRYACDGWTKQARESMDKATGFGPTLFAEWSQADTDCARHLTNVGWGNRWEGSFDAGGDGTAESVLAPRCPAEDSSCSCAGANADPSDYSSPYRKFLKMFAEAQMHSFEQGWGWWYWTWQTESAPQWSYKAGMEAGILPKKAYDREFDCSGNIPDFADLPETY